MTARENGLASSGEQLGPARAELAARLRERWTELEQTLMARLDSIPVSARNASPEYVEGLHRVVEAGFEALLVAVERPEGHFQEVPAAFLSQARLACRSGTSLDTVLRRCFAGYTLFSDILIEEADDRGPLDRRVIKQVMESYALLFNRLVAAITEEYNQEARRRCASAAERRARLVEQVLTGQIRHPPDLDYDFEAHHVGVIARGRSAVQALREVSKSLDRRLLAVECGEETVWAWLGSRRETGAADLGPLVSSFGDDLTHVAVGEPKPGLGGWRTTHRQARAAFAVALRNPHCSINYGDVALLASTLQDDLLATMLRDRYLAPLEGGRDEGVHLRETLRVYLETERNASSTAAALGVDRRTVANRLRDIEERLGRPLRDCAAEVEVALRLARHDAAGPSPGT